MTLTNNDNKPPMRVVRQHTWGALLIYRRIPLAKTQRNAEELPSTGSGSYKKTRQCYSQTLTRFLAVGLGLLAVEPKKFKSLSSKAKSLSFNQPSTSSLVR